MATISEALAIAIQHQQAGRLQAAEQIYRQILAVEPDHADAWHLLGVINGQAGNHQRAVEYIYRALAVKPNWAEAYNNLGNALKDQERLDEAVACYRRALELKPDFAEAHHNQSLLLLLRGDFQRGWAEYQWRWKIKQWRRFSQALWDGQPPGGLY